MSRATPLIGTPLIGAVLVGLLVTGGLVLAQTRPPLADAIKHADRAAIDRLLAQRVNVNATEGDGSTALHWAAYRDDLEAADLLLKAGARVNAANDLGATPLWAAAMNGSEPMVRRLLQGGADPNLALLSGETPLMVASRGGFVPVVALLLGKGANVDVTATRGQTALMWAVSQKHPGVTTLLVGAHANVHVRSAVWSQVMAVSPHGMLQYNKDVPHGGDTALMFAARNGDLESARVLVAAGANVNDADAWGVSATALAAHAGFTALVEFLLDKGANPNTNGGGFTALHAAVMRRDERMVKALLDHKADPNVRVESWTPTRRSSRDWNFNPELVGATPYWLAARVTAPSIMKVLAEHGATTTVLHHAVYHAGDPTEERSQTTTPLMAAVGMGGGVPWVPVDPKDREALTLETVRLALEQGSDVNQKNDDGRTALDAATRLRLPTVVTFLTEHGAQPGTRGALGDRR
ncbi:MAG: ankyrin repeat domain-containing protein [Vicinamibacterales bacterium]